MVEPESDRLKHTHLSYEQTRHGSNIELCVRGRSACV